MGDAKVKKVRTATACKMEMRTKDFRKNSGLVDVLK